PLHDALPISSGESRNVDIRPNPQRLDNLTGKILRIIPDLNEHTSASTVSDNGRYRIPNDNPFVDVPGARPEIWAYGFRNPHRLAFDHKTGLLWVGQNGQDLWESAMVVRRGANYGWSLYEGVHPVRSYRQQGPRPISQPVIEHL